jgi:Rab GDP dissociation inhibitor
MDEDYDAIVCGTGLTECMLSGLLSTQGKKVLHVDRNRYYGGEAASLNLTNLYEKFMPGKAPPPEYGSNRDWNVDLIPKFIMADGKLVKILITTKVTKYLEWRQVNGTFVYQYQAAGLLSGAKYIHKVPAGDVEALKSGLMSLLEKNRCKNFFQYVNSWNINDPSTWGDVDVRRAPMAKLYEKFGLGRDTIDFLGHAVALYTDDSYLTEPAFRTLEKMQLYINSIARYGQSPFIYPVYGLGGLPESFARLSAIHGGTYMLDKPVDKILYGDDGKVCGIESKGEVARAPMVICDPTYVVQQLPHKAQAVGKVIRAICIMGGPIPDTKIPDAPQGAPSCQIIIPQRQLNRRSDIFILLVSSTHCVVPQGKYLAIVSTTVETSTPELELRPALDILGGVETMFTSISDLYIPTDAGQDGLFVSRSFDATSHFESVAEDVLDMWKRITGTELDMTIPADLGDDED